MSKSTMMAMMVVAAVVSSTNAQSVSYSVQSLGCYTSVTYSFQALRNDVSSPVNCAKECSIEDSKAVYAVIGYDGEFTTCYCARSSVLAGSSTQSSNCNNKCKDGSACGGAYIPSPFLFWESPSYYGSVYKLIATTNAPPPPPPQTTTTTDPAPITTSTPAPSDAGGGNGGVTSNTVVVPPPATSDPSVTTPDSNTNTGVLGTGTAAGGPTVPTLIATGPTTATASPTKIVPPTIAGGGNTPAAPSNPPTAGGPGLGPDPAAGGNGGGSNSGNSNTNQQPGATTAANGLSSSATAGLAALGVVGACVVATAIFVIQRRRSNNKLNGLGGDNVFAATKGDNAISIASSKRGAKNDTSDVTLGARGRQSPSYMRQSMDVADMTSPPPALIHAPRATTPAAGSPIPPRSNTPILPAISSSQNNEHSYMDIADVHGVVSPTTTKFGRQRAASSIYMEAMAMNGTSPSSRGNTPSPTNSMERKMKKGKAPVYATTQVSSASTSPKSNVSGGAGAVAVSSAGAATQESRFSNNTFIDYGSEADYAESEVLSRASTATSLVSSGTRSTHLHHHHQQQQQQQPLQSSHYFIRDSNQQIPASAVAHLQHLQTVGARPQSQTSNTGTFLDYGSEADYASSEISSARDSIITFDSPRNKPPALPPMPIPTHFPAPQIPLAQTPQLLRSPQPQQPHQNQQMRDPRQPSPAPSHATSLNASFQSVESFPRSTTTGQDSQSYRTAGTPTNVTTSQSSSSTRDSFHSARSDMTITKVMAGYGKDQDEEEEDGDDIERLPEVKFRW